jgi:hypothetical protein
MLYLEDAESVRLENFESDAVIANTQPQIAGTFQTFDIADAGIGVVCQRAENFDGMLAVDPSQISLGLIRPAKVGPQDALSLEAEFPKNLFMRCAGAGFTACGFYRRALGVRFGFVVFWCAQQRQRDWIDQGAEKIPGLDYIGRRNVVQQRVKFPTNWICIGHAISSYAQFLISSIALEDRHEHKPYDQWETVFPRCGAQTAPDSLPA